jgi:hypothetical protein
MAGWTTGEGGGELTAVDTRQSARNKTSRSSRPDARRVPLAPDPLRRRGCSVEVIEGVWIKDNSRRISIRSGSDGTSLMRSPHATGPRTTTSRGTTQQCFQPSCVHVRVSTGLAYCRCERCGGITGVSHCVWYGLLLVCLSLPRSVSLSALLSHSSSLGCGSCAVCRCALSATVRSVCARRVWVRAVCACCGCVLSVRVVCTRCMCVLSVRVVCACCLCVLYVRAVYAYVCA